LYNYSPLPDADTGEAIGTFTVITRPANPLMARIHNAGPNSHRMPLILSRELALKWLDENLTDQETEKILAFEFPENKLDAWPVNTIRRQKADDESVIEKLTEGTYPAL
jgi:putative SOS response-associated peptidase YedK